MRINQNLYKAIQALGLLQQFNHVARSQSFQEVTQRLESFKDEAKQAFKALSREHHPDLGGDEEHMKSLSAAYDEIKKMKVVPPRPPPMVQFVYVHRSPVTASWTSGTSTTTSTDWW